MSAKNPQSIPAIVGPTGVGKTETSVKLAKALNAELLSVDSRQIYKGMDIGTGKEVDRGEWQQVRGRRALVIDAVPIFGLDLVDPDVQFSVSDWYRYAVDLIQEVQGGGRRLILVGGTGFYLAALEGKVETLDIPPNELLRNELDQLSTPELVSRLSEVNPAIVRLIDPQNKRRLIRAIEVAMHDGELQEVKRPTFTLTMHGMTMKRERLYQKIDRRIDHMIDQGLVQEVQYLLARYNSDLPSMSGIGYAEIASHLKGECRLDEAVQRIKWRNHNYVRRQYTWLRKQKVVWHDLDGDVDWEKQLLYELKSGL